MQGPHFFLAIQVFGGRHNRYTRVCRFLTSHTGSGSHPALVAPTSAAVANQMLPMYRKNNPRMKQQAGNDDRKYNNFFVDGTSSPPNYDERG